MTVTFRFRVFFAAVLAGSLANAAAAPAPQAQGSGTRTSAVAAPVMQERQPLPGSVVVGASRPAQAQVPASATPQGLAAARAAGVTQEPLEEEDTGPQPQLRRGTGQTINRSVAAQPPPNLGGTVGTATFNFEGEALPVVVKAILGDFLKQNYIISPNVQGTVTLSTPRAVGTAEALSLLEMALGWNNARMVYSQGRYNIIPAEQAMPSGTVPIRAAPAADARGFESRVMPLRYVSATEMEKILKPYARQGAIVSVDNGRNVITVAGTRAELENYQRTVEIFDVDWMSSMSVGVFPVQGGAAQTVAALEKVFGEQGKSPVSGMFRFLPLEEANAVMVITSQADYLDDIQQWLERIDDTASGNRLYSYELKYIKAKDLADRLAEVFGSGGGSPESAIIMPGLTPSEVGADSQEMTGKTGDAGAGQSGAGAGFTGNMALEQAGSGNAAVMLEVNGDKVGVSAVDETNTLLVRANGPAWRSIKEVIQKLDVMPLQVHIEAQVAEVELRGDLRYGVNWFFGASALAAGIPAGTPNGTLGANISGVAAGAAANLVSAGLGWTYVRNGAAAIIGALDSVTDVHLLQTPSIFVRNNAEGTLNVGSRIPVNSVTFNPSTGTDGTISQVQYLDTGIILKVRPRITKDGMVFLDIVQEVSSPGAEASNGNYRINTRRMKTEAAVRTGETIMLAGLIEDRSERSAAGMPGLSRIPVIGGLFGQQVKSKGRNEVIILITPTIVRDPQSARDFTDEYGRRFRAMEPLRSTGRQR